MTIRTIGIKRPSSDDSEAVKKRKRVSFSKNVESTEQQAKDEDLSVNGRLVPKPKKGILKKKVLANANGCLQIKEKSSDFLEDDVLDSKDGQELNNFEGKRNVSIRKRRLQPHKASNNKFRHKRVIKVKQSTKEILMKMTKKERKQFIRELEKKNKPNYELMMKAKLFTKEQRVHIISSLKGNYVRLYKSLFSASLVNEIYAEWGNAKQYRQLVSEFYGPEFAILQENSDNLSPPSIDEISTQTPDKMAGILQNLEKLLDRAVLKVPMLKLSITHKLLYDFLRYCSDEQRNSLIESLKDFLPEICHTHEGSYAALLCVWNSTPEQRTSIVKSFTGLAISACKDNFVQRVLFGIFDCVDDTNLVNKIIIKQIANNIADLIYDKHGVIVLHYLVHPRDPHVIAKSLQNILQQGDLNPHTKLDKASRYLNLFECVKPALLTFMKANMREIITNKISAVLILDTLDVNSPSSPFKRNIDINDLSSCFKEIAQIATDEFIPHCVDKERPLHIIAGGCARFVFRKLLKNDRLREKEEEKLSFYLMSILKRENLQSWTGMDCGCYTLIEIIESGSDYARKTLKLALDGNNNLKNQWKFSNIFLGFGGTGLLSISWFTSSKKENDEKNDANVDKIIRDADILYNAYLIDNAYGILRRYRSSENSELLWRLARVICEQGKQSKNVEEKNRLFREAFEIIEKALKCEPAKGSFGTHKWYAILLNIVSELDGDKAQLSKAVEVRNHFERALELDPLDATTWHSLGVWHYSFANLSISQRFLAGIFYSRPPNSTYVEALRHFENAEAIKPGFYSANNYYMGLTLEQMNRPDEAKVQFILAFIAPVISMDDGEIHKKAFDHLHKKYKLTREQIMEEHGKNSKTFNK
uniref:CPL domain-containing protein n=1 Tax=Meloidogyne javanica TaxID=6303 RepID=A0A915LF70_MELJA